MKIHDPHVRAKGSFQAVELLLVVLSVLLLSACGSSQPPPAQVAADIHNGDVCTVCGMSIEAGPGPRGEAYVQGHKAPLKFGSTRDFFAYVLQPENTTKLQNLLVQDSAQIDWMHPSNAARTFIDARTAYYVAWQPLRGLMGPTYASFASKKDAETFVGAHGGEILRFSEVTAELTSMLEYGCPAQGSPAFALAKNCVKPSRPADPPLATRDKRADLRHGSSSASH